MPRRLLEYLRRAFGKRERIVEQVRRPEERKLSRTWFKDKVSKRAFKFSIAEQFVIKDKYPEEKVTNPIIPFETVDHSLLLSDNKGNRRFVLTFAEVAGSIEISAIQRLRTQYIKRENDKFEWVPELETEASKKFAQELGMHPAEFVLCEFLYSFANQIKSGKRVKLRIYKMNGYDKVSQTYRGLIDRFFKPKSVFENNVYIAFELSLDKDRVKSILGI